MKEAVKVLYQKLFQGSQLCSFAITQISLILGEMQTMGFDLIKISQIVNLKDFTFFIQICIFKGWEAQYVYVLIKC